MSRRVWLKIAVGLFFRHTRDDALFLGMTNAPRWVRRTRPFKWAARKLMEHWHPTLKRK